MPRLPGGGARAGLPPVPPLSSRRVGAQQVLRGHRGAGLSADGRGAGAPPDLDGLARTAGYSRFPFHRLFKSLTGVTPYTYWTAVRAQRVRAEPAGARTVSDAVHQAGFHSNGQFYAVSSGILGDPRHDSAGVPHGR